MGEVYLQDASKTVDDECADVESQTNLFFSNKSLADLSWTLNLKQISSFLIKAWQIFPGSFLIDLS